MGYQISWPKDKAQRETTVSNLVTQGKSRRNTQQVKWWVNSFYMQGIRDFTSVDYLNGSVSVGYLNKDGVLKFRYEEIVSKYQSQLGRLMAVDLSPAIERRSISLDGLRKSSVAQVVLNAAMPQDKVDKLKLELNPPLLLYGTVGVGLWVNGPDSQGIEVIMPWELLPIPTNISGPNDVRGLIRIRYVPKEWIQNLTITPGKGTKVYKNIEGVSVPTGNMPVNIDSAGGGLVAMSAGGGGYSLQSVKSQDMSGRASKKKDETNTEVTQLVEVWTETTDGYLADYSIYAGMANLKELYTFNHSSAKYPMPIRIIRDVTVGSFWGRSYVDQLIPLNHELEVALSSVFQSVSDFDLYGIQMWPTTLGTPPLAMRGQDGIKRITYEPDYTSDNLKPFNIEPAKMTAPQIQAVQLAAELMDKVANQPQEMMSGGAPGRVDSSAGLGFLYETSGIPLSPTAKSMAMGVSGIYRAMLRILKDTWDDQKVVSISNLDDSLAGIILDTESGTLSLSQNAIPFPDEVIVTIASEIPISKEQQKFELKEALREQRITLDEFNFKARTQGLDIPVGGDFEWQNYRRAMLENIQLFGDGKVPGKVVVSDRDLHRIHLMVIDTFMARPEFYAASKEVRDAFVLHRDEHYYGQASMLEQMPQPEEAAEMMMEPPQGGGEGEF